MKCNTQLLSFVFQPQSVHELDSNGKSALHYCAESSNLQCIDQIIEAEPRLLNQVNK